MQGNVLMKPDHLMQYTQHQKWFVASPGWMTKRYKCEEVNTLMFDLIRARIQYITSACKYALILGIPGRIKALTIVQMLHCQWNGGMWKYCL